jgi:hypothetical protein
LLPINSASAGAAEAEACVGALVVRLCLWGGIVVEQVALALG